MKIAYVITRADDIGGAQVHVRDLTEALLAQGHEVTILAGGSGVFSDELAALGIRHRSIRHLGRAIAPVDDLLALWEIIRALREIQPELVSAHTSKAGLLGRIAGAVLGYPVIFTPHGWAITNRISTRQGWFFRRMESLASLISARIINVCEFEAELAREYRVAPGAKLAVVHNGIADIGEELRADATLQPPRLVMTARMSDQKDHATLLAALSRLKHLDWNLDLIGNGPLENKLKRQAAGLGIANRIRFLGFCGDAAARLREAQIFVLATRYEAFPYSILEAMRAGLPVVATDVGGNREAVIMGQTGLLVPPGDVAALASHLASLIVNPELRKRLGDHGRDRYLAHFTFDQMLAKTLRVYQEVVPAGSAAGRPQSVEGSGRRLEPTAAFAWSNAGVKSKKCD